MFYVIASFLPRDQTQTFLSHETDLKLETFSRVFHRVFHRVPFMIMNIIHRFSFTCDFKRKSSVLKILESIWEIFEWKNKKDFNASERLSDVQKIGLERLLKDSVNLTKSRNDNWIIDKNSKRNLIELQSELNCFSFKLNATLLIAEWICCRLFKCFCLLFLYFWWCKLMFFFAHIFRLNKNHFKTIARLEKRFA